VSRWFVVQAITQKPYIDGHPRAAGAVICDALAVALVLSPSLITGHEQRAVKVALDHGACRGQTIVDRRIFVQGHEPISRRLNVTIVTDVDQVSLESFVDAVLVDFVLACQA
jgi:inosine-uridine nucleoside N-ribohydrolase